MEIPERDAKEGIHKVATDGLSLRKKKWGINRSTTIKRIQYDAYINISYWLKKNLFYYSKYFKKVKKHEVCIERFTWAS